jgi:hypothetical protein
MVKRTRYEKVYHNTNDKVITDVTRDGSRTTVDRKVKKSDGLFGTRFLGTTKHLSSSTKTKSKGWW